VCVSLPSVNGRGLAPGGSSCVVSLSPAHSSSFSQVFRLLASWGHRNHSLVTTDKPNRSAALARDTPIAELKGVLCTTPEGSITWELVVYSCATTEMSNSNHHASMYRHMRLLPAMIECRLLFRLTAGAATVCKRLPSLYFFSRRSYTPKIGFSARI
jgi:hypothetical protein